MPEEQYSGYSEWKGWTGNAFGAVTKSEVLYFREEMAGAAQTDFSEKRVVEIGFGNGSFATWCISKGAKYAGVEIQPNLLATAKQHGLEVYSAELPFADIFPENSIDLIVAFDVFEHIARDDLARFFLQYSKTLRENGLLIARVPSGDSPFARAIQHGDLTHKTALGSSALRQLADGAGLEIMSIHEPAFPLLGQGMLVFFRRALIAGLRSLTYGFIRNVLMANRSAVLSPNMIFSMRKNAKTVD